DCYKRRHGKATWRCGVHAHKNRPQCCCSNGALIAYHKDDAYRKDFCPKTPKWYDITSSLKIDINSGWQAKYVQAKKCELRDHTSVATYHKKKSAGDKASATFGTVGQWISDHRPRIGEYQVPVTNTATGQQGLQTRRYFYTNAGLAKKYDH
ncbi:unnamed protein product, partial [Symbiodinium pilosum]